MEKSLYLAIASHNPNLISNGKYRKNNLKGRLPSTFKLNSYHSDINMRQEMVVYIFNLITWDDKEDGSLCV